MSTLVSCPEIEALTTRSKSIWMAGDYDHFSRYMESDARAFYERLKPSPGSRFLDVSCGSGQLAMLAARDGLAVTGVDIGSPLDQQLDDVELALASGNPQSRYPDFVLGVYLRATGEGGLNGFSVAGPHGGPQGISFGIACRSRTGYQSN